MQCNNINNSSHNIMIVQEMVPSYWMMYTVLDMRRICYLVNTIQLVYTTAYWRKQLALRVAVSYVFSLHVTRYLQYCCRYLSETKDRDKN